MEKLKWLTAVVLLVLGCGADAATPEDFELPRAPDDVADERSGIAYTAPNGISGLVAGSAAPTPEAPDAAVPVEPEETEQEPTDIGEPVPVYGQDCDGVYEDIELRYRVTVYNTDLVMSECWETFGNATAFRKYLLNPGDEGYGERTCLLTGERPWAFTTFAVDGVLGARAAAPDMRVVLQCQAR